MLFQNYISFVKEGESEISEYQFNSAKKDYKEHEFKDFFYGSLYANTYTTPRHSEKASTTIKKSIYGFAKDFLDFHYNDYPGLKEDFLLFVKEAIQMGGGWLQGLIQDDDFLKERKKEVDNYILNKWSPEKKNNLLNEDNIKGISKKKQREKKTYYTWTGELKDLNTLYKVLELYLFDEKGAVSFDSFKAIFSLSQTRKPIPVTCNRVLAFTLNKLKEDGLIIDKPWQKIALDGKLFISSQGKQLDNFDLSSALSQGKRGGFPENCEKIAKAINEIKKPS